jgi:1,2-diacylglycerol 3-beta-glucosyltransferase
MIGEGLAGWQLGAFIASLIVISISLVWNIWLFRIARRSEVVAGESTMSADDFTWVFLVPALNEEVTIADSVGRLLEVRCARRHIVVIDDGSTDRTPEVLAGINSPDLRVLRRNEPEAQLGKADALNDAWRRLPSMIDDLDAQHTIVCVIDADGRLDPDSPSKVAGLFSDPRVGGVQVRVRIYNRHVALTRAQDIEFGVYGLLYQAARSAMGTAGMGGNGQFNRLATLDEVADGSAPWRDKLTEDQDIGLRMLAAGWRCRHDNRAWVDQQGVANLRRLLRQRTRWSQGNLQALTHLRDLPRYEVTRRARFDLLWALLQPVASAIVGFGVFAAVFAFFIDDASFVQTSWLLVLAFFVLGFGGVIIGVTARAGRGPRAWARGLLIGVLYSAYTWLLWPVLIRATWRLVMSKHTWAKTEREALPPLDLTA